ncbi:hypothetical protein [Prauserella cavernicola]|uniref:Uncharacterized protein n=1 Tax=Prauserella cavernicola TaxID=2800127 RepID=A0A934QPV9_9PSEU|nr:hypothetical protein [Prauserella cavernicola]MBK1784430.1 hypothetical protein [Prauserella cavernicola]
MPEGTPSAEDGLPPRPDPETGKPFPPHAPGYTGNDKHPEANPLRDITLSRKPKPPAGLGTTLAWWRDSPKAGLARAAFAFALMVVGVAVIGLSGDGDLSIFGIWPIWIVIVVFAYLASNPFNIDTISAGADWVQSRRSRFKRTNYVKVYELTKIRISYGGGDLHLAIYDNERGMDRTYSEWHRDRRIWDLVYNGIVHSVANGADIRPRDIGALQLRNNPALHLREQRSKHERK